MDNNEIANRFSLLSKLLDIHGENSFKSKSYSIAAYKIDQLTVELKTLPREKIFQITGIGEAIGKKILELVETGKMKVLEEIISKTPEGILDLMKIKGLGPKKIGIIWREMNVESIGELLYACNENRLSLLKGFGKKTQDNVIESIEFFLRQQGNYLYAQVEDLVIEMQSLLATIFSTDSIRITGVFARQLETLDELEFVIPFPVESILELLRHCPAFVFIKKTDDFVLYKYDSRIKIKLFASDKQLLVKRTFETTNSAPFNSAFYNLFREDEIQKAKSDEEIFHIAGIQYILPCLRESEKAIQLAIENKIPALIQPNDIKGIIHCHSNWSDGSNTLEELVGACIKNQYEYLVISDHSKAA